jgi:PPOX class probable F420-dependent enzyme
MLVFTRSERVFIRAARVAHLATADGAGQPHVIPICFILDGGELFSPIDEKPKQSSPGLLRRIRNIGENPKICLLVDRYDEDWRKLAYVLVIGTAKILLRGKRHQRAVRLLRRKYPQYRSMALNERPVIRISPKRVVSWAFAKTGLDSRK